MQVVRQTLDLWGAVTPVVRWDIPPGRGWLPGRRPSLTFLPDAASHAKSVTADNGRIGQPEWRCLCLRACVPCCTHLGHALWCGACLSARTHACASREHRHMPSSPMLPTAPEAPIQACKADSCALPAYIPLSLALLPAPYVCIASVCIAAPLELSIFHAAQAHSCATSAMQARQRRSSYPVQPLNADRWQESLPSC